MHITPRILCAAGAALLMTVHSASFATAQSLGVHQTLISSPATTIEWGRATVLVDDVDGDGIDDIAVGGPKALFGVGRVRVYSGATYALIWEVTGGGGALRFGTSLASLPDQNGDGIGEIAVGAPLTNIGGVQAGAAYVLSGANGSVLTPIIGAIASAHLGETLAALRFDIPAMTYLAVGSPASGGNGGSFTLYNPVTGAGVYIYNHLTPGDGCATAIANVGDFDGDGSDDLGVGFPNRVNAAGGFGEVRIYSFEALGLYSVTTISGSNTAKAFGSAIDGAGDLDADGLDDVIIGDPEFSNGPDSFCGKVQTFAGPDGNLYASVQGLAANHRLGTAVAGIGDLDGDGYDDVAYGEPRSAASTTAPRVIVRSGRSWTTLGSYVSPTMTPGFGSSIARVGDLDEDGLVDLLVANPDDDLVQIIGANPLHVGSRDDLAFGVGLDGAPPTVWPDQKVAAGGLPLTLRVHSPNGSFVGTPPAVAAWMRPNAAPGAMIVAFPELHVLPAQTVVLFDPFAVTYFGPTILAPNGFSLAGLTPNGFLGFTIVLQGFVIAPSAVTGNPFFTAANAIELVLL